MTNQLAYPDGTALDTAAQFTLSALAADPAISAGLAFHEWWADRHRAGRFEVVTIPFSELDKWHFRPDGGNLVHESGKFFAIEGVGVRDGGTSDWSRPIINQPEIGVLGILVKEFDGVLHCLMQAKMEPGNVNTLQLSPTVQATRSNYTRIHRGGDTRYLEHFRGPTRGEVLVDVLQSEQGAWFWHKSNRNMVVRVTGEVPVHEDFCWLTLHQIRALLRTDNLINMDARTVLSCMPFAHPSAPVGPAVDAFTDALLRSYQSPSAGPAAASLHTPEEVLTWFIEAKTRCEWTSRLLPLTGITGWTRTADEIGDDEGRSARIIAVRVAAGNREVTTWTQPLLAPRDHGLAAFLARPIKGVLHLLVQARPEPGLLDILEMAPTVQLPNCDGSATDSGTPFVDEVFSADPGRVRFDSVLSEEGGRFYHSQTRYRVVEVGDEFPVEVPENYCWMTVRQLMDLLRHGHYLNIEARSLLACVHSLW
ncbi:NDP-hexose 2,3-dehydratase family protein [Solwaraspora sp. WMMD1047]|uniref:NDP-hexose 2,3-dehydratase family protein n=1 Tax=Solwaraspora sp. WMMD1047 TaxID=3016102 RepID=UPI0024173F27|nr:NDP-hexose 2,3-dehydratase family protein [Solwaraspora sp. WMMD1047]MDG4827790.1 NDP-hexose 2,3-dehydratase family protein [Solwaraspora sp. WMMD1047]